MRKFLFHIVAMTSLFTWADQALAEDKAIIDRLADVVEIHAVGFEPTGQATIAHLDKKGEKAFEQAVEQGYCYRFLAVGEKDSFKLGLRVTSGADILGETSSPLPVALLDACASSDQTFKASVSTKAFGGDFIYAVYRVKSKKTPAKGEVGARMLVLAQKNVPGASLVAVPTTAVLAKGKGFSLTVEVQAETCYKFLAVGGSGVDDVSIQVKSKAQIVTEDTTTGDHPIVEYCPKSAGTVVVQVVATAGQGAVLASAFLAPASAILVGVNDAQTALDNRLESEAEIYAPDMNRVGIVHSGDIVNKKPLWFDVQLAKGVCYKFIAVGGAGIDDLDIELKKTKANKQVMSKDTTDDDAPIAAHCADASDPAVIKLASLGSGSYSFAVYAGASAEAGATAGYEDLVNAMQKAFAGTGDGYEPAGSMETVVLGDQTEAGFDLKMASDRCYGLLVVGLGDVAALSMTVTGDGNKLASATKSQSTLFVEHCPDSDVVAVVKIASISGQGPAAYQAFSKPSDVDQVFIPIGGLSNSFIAKAIRKMHGKSGKYRPAVTDMLSGDLDTAKTRTFDVELKGDKCYTILAAGNPSVKELHVKLTSPIGEEIASGKDQGSKVVVHTTPCPKWNGTYKLEVKMFMGYGEFGVQVFGE